MKKDRYFRRKKSRRKGIYIYYFFLESKQGCCLNLNLGCNCLVKKMFLSFSKQVASLIKECQYVGLARLNYDKNYIEHPFLGIVGGEKVWHI